MEKGIHISDMKIDYVRPAEALELLGTISVKARENGREKVTYAPRDMSEYLELEDCLLTEYFPEPLDVGGLGPMLVRFGGVTIQIVRPRASTGILFYF